MEAVESVASFITNDIFQSSFLAGDIDIYEAPIEFYIKQGNIDSAFQLVERTKSRTLAQLISQGLEWEKISESPLMERMKALKEKLNSLYSTSRDKSFRDAAIAQPIKKEIVNVEREIKELFYELNAESKANFNTILPESEFGKDLKATIMEQLNSETIILEYYFVEEQLFLFTISDSDFEFIKLSIQKNELHRKLNKFNYRINDARYDRNVSPTKIQIILKELYDLLIPSISNKIENFNNLIIIPHSILHNFPFHLLYDGTSYLLENYTISYAPSAQILNFCHREKDLSGFQKPNPLIMAYNPDDIPYVVQEAEAISSLFPESNCFIQQDAMVSHLKEYASQSEIIHLSVHGQFREDNPLFSSLQFASSTASRNSLNTMHDYLTVHDIYYLKLNSRLVTLSGCQTGKNFITAADDLMGLARGFFAAGATSILASLWSVEDAATSELMLAFYQNIKEGKSVGQALKEAQLALMEKYEHPFYWGGFMLMGCAEFRIEFNSEMVE
jgi:CHAT domain-containing protein